MKILPGKTSQTQPSIKRSTPARDSINFCLSLLGAIILLLAVLYMVGPAARTTYALPEYSATVGEPCATCHISPSGGGNRTPRGQAWVGSNKPGEVPDLVQALEILGVHLEVDPSMFTTVPETIQPAEPLKLKSGAAGTLNQWLRNYPGN